MSSISVRDRLTGLWRSAGARTAARGSAWTISGYAVSTVLRFISRIVLAKLLLDPAPLGTVAVVSTILTGIELVSELGINVSVVQHKRGADRAFLGTAYSVQALRGLVLWAVGMALAYPAAWFYHDPSIAPLMMFASLTSLMRGAVNPGLFLKNRDVQLRTPTLINMASEVGGFAVTVAWALVSPSAWALVAGTVAGTVVTAAGSHLFAPRIGFKWDKEAAHEIVRFGGWILLATAVWFLSSRGETLMLKGRVPEVEFGTFAFASMLVTMPSMAVVQLGSQVFMPMMSRWLRDDRATAERQYVRARWVFTAVAFCFAAGAIFVGPIIVKLLHLKPSFSGLAFMVQVLGVRAAFDILAAAPSALVLAGGKTSISARASTVRLIAMVGGLAYAVPHWGLTGGIYALILASAISHLALIPGLRRFVPNAERLELLSYGVFLAAVAGLSALYVVLGA